LIPTQEKVWVAAIVAGPNLDVIFDQIEAEGPMLDDELLWQGSVEGSLIIRRVGDAGGPIMRAEHPVTPPGPERHRHRQLAFPANELDPLFAEPLWIDPVGGPARTNAQKVVAGRLEETKPDVLARFLPPMQPGLEDEDGIGIVCNAPSQVF